MARTSLRLGRGETCFLPLPYSPTAAEPKDCRLCVLLIAVTVSILTNSLAFKGWTFKSPAANAHIHLTNPETRYGHLEALVDGRFSAGSEASGKHGHEQEGTDETIVPNVIPASGVMNAFDEGKSEEAGLSGFGTVRLADGTGTVRSRALSL